MWPIVFALPSEQAQHLGRDVLRDFLSGAENGILLSAPAESSLGPRARAARILRDGTAIIEEVPQDEAGKDAWRLKVECVAREIDASFTHDGLPADLAALRTRIAGVLAPDTSAGLPSAN